MPSKVNIIRTPAATPTPIPILAPSERLAVGEGDAGAVDVDDVVSDVKLDEVGMLVVLEPTVEVAEDIDDDDIVNENDVAVPDGLVAIAGGAEKVTDPCALTTLMY